MALKTMQLLIGGEERQLKFGTVAFFKFAGEVYKGDPMELVYGISTLELLKFSGSKNKEDKERVTELLTGISDPAKLYNIIYAFVYGGLRCGGNEVTPEQVNEWVSDMDFTTGSELLKTGRAALTDVRNEENKEEGGQGEAAGQTDQEPG